MRAEASCCRAALLNVERIGMLTRAFPIAMLIVKSWPYFRQENAEMQAHFSEKMSEQRQAILAEG